MSVVDTKPPSAYLRRKIFQIQRLGTQAQVVWWVMEALSDERTGAEQLARIIESDMALSSKILSLANSAYYRRSNKVTTIQRAVVTIGLKEIEFLTLGLGLADVFRDQGAGNGGNGLWEHSLAVAWAARELAMAAGQTGSAEFMVAGLLHDLGKLVLLAHLPQEKDRIAGLVNQGVSYFEAEERLGLEHYAIGFWLAERWSLPEVHAAVIRDHHHPNTKSPFFAHTCGVALADRVVKDLQIGLVEESRPLNRERLAAGFGLGKRAYLAVVKQLEVSLPQRLETWRAMLHSGPSTRAKSGLGSGPG